MGLEPDQLFLLFYFCVHMISFRFRFRFFVFVFVLRKKKNGTRLYDGDRNNNGDQMTMNQKNSKHT